MRAAYLLEYTEARADDSGVAQDSRVLAAARDQEVAVDAAGAWHYLPITAVETDDADSSLDLIVGDPGATPLSAAQLTDAVRALLPGRDEHRVFVCTYFESESGHGYRQDVRAVALRWHSSQRLLAVAKHYDGWEDELFGD